MISDSIGMLLLPLVLDCGYLGVDLFFILSGFVISYRYGDSVRSSVGHPYRRFLWARLGRIYPVHLVTLLTMLGLVGLALTSGVSLPENASFEIGDFVAHGLLRLAGSFVAGCLLQRFFKAGLGRTVPWHTVSLTALLLLPTLALVTVHSGVRAFATAPILLALMIYGLAKDDRRGWGRILAAPIMRYGGRISYSFYMVQGVSLAIAGSIITHFTLFPMTASAAGLLIMATTGATLLLALLLYHRVEVPGREAIRRWCASRRSCPSVPSSQPRPAGELWWPLSIRPGCAAHRRGSATRRR
jgi:peptidoglycan/LPS O-acetylase OafA/YrhL